MPELKLPFWLGQGELARLAKALHGYWLHIQAALELPLKQLNLETAPMGLVELVAWQRGIDRQSSEPEETFRLRVSNAFAFAVGAGERTGFESILKTLNIGVIGTDERNPENDWDVITIQLVDGELATKGELVNAILRQYGRTCRRYRFKVTYPDVLSIRRAVARHSHQVYAAKLGS